MPEKIQQFMSHTPHNNSTVTMTTLMDIRLHMGLS